MRAGNSYRSARRNEVKAIRGVWKSSITPRYAPALPHGTSAKIIDGKRHPELRVAPRTYKPNGDREVARRIRQAA